MRVHRPRRVSTTAAFSITARTVRGVLLTAPLLALLACGPGDPEPLPADSFAFAVFGDGPYTPREQGRFRAVVKEVNADDLEWLIHVGDIMDGDCSDDMYAERLKALNSIQHPVIYTPGDNEWTDCHHNGAAPVERLQHLRSVFFVKPGTTLGARTMQVATQASNPKYAEFVENVRWRRGGFVFITLHVVGSLNGSEDFQGRKADNDREVARRTEAALVWLVEAFAIAYNEGLRGVVIAFHGDPRFHRERAEGYETLVTQLRILSARFPGSVAVIHGDSHEQRIDKPLTDPATGRVLENFTRIETYGSPDIGWIRVVVDSAAGRITSVEPRLMRRLHF